MKPRRMFALTMLISLLLAAGCCPTPAAPAPPTAAALPAPQAKTRFASATPSLPAETQSTGLSSVSIGLTYPRLDGSRWLVGSGGQPAEPLDIPLAGLPRWVVAAPVLGGSLWVVALENGQLQAFQVVGREATVRQLNFSSLPPGMPPVLTFDGDSPALLVPPENASPDTHPVPLPDGTLAYLDALGQLHLQRPAGATTLAVYALPDARLLVDERGRLLFLSDPTDQYPHGVLGDQLEAASITLVDPRQETPVIQAASINPGEVIEGLAPIWADLDGDGVREIIVTQSNPSTGARLVAYRADGSLLAEGEPVGARFRWRHQLAVGQFIPGGGPEVAVVRTPHLGGVIEIYALTGDRLEIQAELAGYSSHQLGSRNLDGALAADLNGDGQLELVLADQAQTTLAGIQYTDGSLAAVWTAPIGGMLRTNLAAVRLPDGRLALGVGHSGNMLRLWLPE